MYSGRPLFVFSHLRWDFVYQRPQHLLSRLATDRRVIYIEEPVYDDSGSTPFWETSAPAPGVLVLRPHTAEEFAGFSDQQINILRPMIHELVSEEAPDGYDIWMYTPMALPLIEDLCPVTLIFDSMDELSAFKGAPTELKDRETALLSRLT